MSGMTRSWRITVGLSRWPRSTALAGVLAVVEDDVGLAGEHPAHGLADHRLIVDQQDGDLVLGQGGFGRSWSGRSGTAWDQVAEPLGDGLGDLE